MSVFETFQNNKKDIPLNYTKSCLFPFSLSQYFKDLWPDQNHTISFCLQIIPESHEWNFPARNN